MLEVDCKALEVSVSDRSKDVWAGQHGVVDDEQLHVLRVESEIPASNDTFRRSPNLMQCVHRRPLVSCLVITRLTVGALLGIVQSLRIIPIYIVYPSRSTRSLPLASPRRRSNDVVYTKE